MTKKRSEFDVIVGILRVAVLDSKKSEMMVDCDLNLGILERY